MPVNKVSNKTLKVGVFIDAPSLSKNIKQKYQLEVNPLLLADALVTKSATDNSDENSNNRVLTLCSFHTGVIPENAVNAYNRKAKQIHDTRADYLKETGVIVHEHELKFDKQDKILDKNIKIGLVLDILETLVNGDIDVAIVCSQDEDVSEVANTFANIRKTLKRKDQKIEGVLIAAPNQKKINSCMEAYDNLQIIKDKNFLEEAAETLVYDDPNLTSFKKAWHEQHADLEAKLKS